MPNKFNSDILLHAANTFYKRAQNMEWDTDPMKKALNAAIGNNIKSMVTDAFKKSISSVQINIKYDPEMKSAQFAIYADGTPEDQAELTTKLNTLAPKAYAIMSKYQKTPLDYKYTEYNRP